MNEVSMVKVRHEGMQLSGKILLFGHERMSVERSVFKVHLKAVWLRGASAQAGVSE